MKSMKYGSKEKPDDLVEITVPDHIELPARIEVRYPDNDYESQVFWGLPNTIIHY